MVEAMVVLMAIAVSSVLNAQERGLQLRQKNQAGMRMPFINGNYRALVIGNDRYRDPEGHCGALSQSFRYATTE